MEMFDQDGNPLPMTPNPDGTWTLVVPEGVTSIRSTREKLPDAAPSFEAAVGKEFTSAGGEYSIEHPTWPRAVHGSGPYPFIIGTGPGGGSGGHTGVPLSWCPCPACGDLAPPAGGNGGPDPVFCPHCKIQIS